MGTIVHHAIVVTSYGDNIIAAHKKAEELGCSVSSIVDSHINGYRSFLIAPDGSKSGWDVDKQGDEQREAFRAWLASRRYDDGSSPYEWVEIGYSNDQDWAAVTDSEFPVV